MYIYCDGQIVSADKCLVSPFDHSFLYGHGLFETMRAYNGRVFKLQDHLNRLEAAAKYLQWPSLPGHAELREAIDKVLRYNQLTDASVRLTLSRGVGTPRPDPSSCGRPSVMVFASPLPPPLPPEGWRIATVTLRRNLSSPLVGIKSANYLDNILAKQEAQALGAQEALMLNTNGYVAEGSMSNIFFVTSGRLITPDEDSGILPGITRRTIIELALQAKIPLEIRQVTLEELSKADEMFLTSSVMEVIPVAALDGRWRSKKPAAPGTVTCMLQDMYQELVRKE